MITPELVSDKKKVSSVECAICKASKNAKVRIKKLGRSYGVVCSDCLEGFTDNDLELMHNMFAAFGGHFGKLSGSKEFLYSQYFFVICIFLSIFIGLIVNWLGKPEPLQNSIPLLFEIATHTVE